MAEKKQNGKTKEMPHHTGHRQRLKEKFVIGGEKALFDYEVLEVFLFRSIPRRDTKLTAKTLIEKFKGFDGMFGASVDELCSVKGIGRETAIDLKIASEIMNRVRKEKLVEKPITAENLNKWSALIQYCIGMMAHMKIEQFRILFLDVKNQLIADEVQQTGTVDHTAVYPREIVKRALAFNASGIVLVHNHPSGDPAPSKADVEMTRQIKEATKTIKVNLIDHIIIGANGYASMKGLKLI